MSGKRGRSGHSPATPFTMVPGGNLVSSTSESSGVERRRRSRQRVGEDNTQNTATQVENVHVQRPSPFSSGPRDSSYRYSSGMGHIDQREMLGARWSKAHGGAPQVPEHVFSGIV